MKKAGILILVILTLWSCEEEVQKVSFRIETNGFILTEAFVDKEEAFPSFPHRVSGGIVKFTNSHKTYEFRTGNTSIEDFEFHLPEGTYLLTFEIPQASLYGQEGGSFIADPGYVNINALTKTIQLRVKANCSMFLVKDDLNQLEKGVYMIERHSYAYGHFWSYPLHTDTLSGLYYTYFTPDTVPSDPSAFLWFYGERPDIEEGGLTTKDFEIGYQYNISILE